MDKEKDLMIQQLVKALNIHQANIQTLYFALDYLVEKLNIDVQDLNNYINERMKQYIEEMQKKEPKLIIPPDDKAGVMN